MASVIVELYSVCLYIKRPDGQKGGGQVYGRIACHDAGGTLDFYNLERDDAKSIDSDGILSLSIPLRCIKGPYFDLTLFLREKHHDLEVSRGYLSFNDYNHPALYDQHACYVVHGKNGCAMVHFTMFHSAVQATIEIVLFAGGDTASSSTSGCTLFGSIYACSTKYKYNDWYSKKYYRSALFDALQDKPTILESGNNKLRLSRNVVAVPRDSSLVIEANLWDYSNTTGIGDSEVTAQIASGSAVFKAQLSGTSRQLIKGPAGYIEVKVSFLDSPLNTQGPGMESYHQALEGIRLANIKLKASRAKQT